MKWTGKLLGVIIGVLLGSPLTALVGLLIGHLFDSGWLPRRRFASTFHRQPHGHTQTVFFNSSFLVMGYIAKSDGRISPNEIRIAESVMAEMNLSPEMKLTAIQLFNNGKQPGFNLDSTLHSLQSTCRFHPSLLSIFIDIQLKMAFADGQILSPKKRQALEYVCSHLGLRGVNFSHFEQRHRSEQQYSRQSYQQQYRSTSQASLNDAHRILGISASASDDEVKKAYRRQMSEHHPDKLIAKGLPPEMIKVATEKTQQIKKAYEQIRDYRKQNT